MNRKNTTRHIKKAHNQIGRKLCSYKDCMSHKKVPRNGAKTLFCFPVKDTERCSVWITNSGREEFRYLTPKELANKRICELHFEEFMFSNFFKTNLKKNAVPNQFDKATPEMFQNNDDDSNDEGESGIASESSSTHNNRDLINVLSNNGTVTGEEVVKRFFKYRCSVFDGKETTWNSKCKGAKHLLPAELLLIQRQLPSVVSRVKDSRRSPHSRNVILRHKSSTKQNVREANYLMIVFIPKTIQSILLILYLFFLVNFHKKKRANQITMVVRSKGKRALVTICALAATVLSVFFFFKIGKHKCF